MEIFRGIVLTLVLAGGATLAAALSVPSEEKPDGAEIYKSKCSMCHAADGKGFSAIKTPDFTDAKWQASVKDKDILEAIKNGKKDTAMPAFANKLSEKEILAVLAQVRAFGKKK
jgi:cbb3-type cytochrome c oxidase subunit III